MSPQRMQQRQGQLLREAAETAARLEEDALSGRRTWLVLDSPTPWDRELMQQVSERLEIDHAESSRELGLVCLTPAHMSRAP